MNLRATSATFVVSLAALAAWLRPVAPSPPAAAPAQDASAPAAVSSVTDVPSDRPPTTAAREYPDGAYLIQRYLHSAIDAKDAPAAGQSLGVAIVTVPDPTDSHMDWAFDTYVESVRRAYERAGYTLDRFWLPWLEKTDTMAQGFGARARRVREEFPGVMLFRRVSGASAGLQIVYLVGEVPTAGVHKGALRRALNERDRLLPASTTARDTVRIVGPSFSGSAASIAQVLGEWSRDVHRLGPPPRGGAAQPAPGRRDVVKVVSGAATLSQNLLAFGNGSAGPAVIYKATVNTDEVLTRVLLCSVLSKLRIRPEQVLLLHESGTAYGNAADGAGPRDNAVSATCDESGERMSSAGFVRIPFPMNISSLRAEYDAHPPAAAGPALDAAGAEERSRTRLSLSDPERPMERVPVTSGLTAPALELLMDQIEDAASRHDVRAVGIMATDVRDKLFLAEEMRSRLRNVTFFTFEGNTLFLRPGKNAWYRGMLVLSTYPLSLENQWWTGGGGERQLFPFANEGAQGVYNAVLIQLGRADAVAEYQRPFDDGIGGGPPVWVSVVGSRAFLPLLYKPVDDSVHVQALPVRPTVTRDAAGLAFFTVLALLMLAVAVGYAALWRPGTLELPQRRLDVTGLALAERVRWGSQILHRHLYAFLRVLALLSVLVPASVLTYTSVSTPPATDTSVLRTIAWIMAALVTAIALTLGFAGWKVAKLLAAAADPAPQRETTARGATAAAGEPARALLKPAAGSATPGIVAVAVVALLAAGVAWRLGVTIPSAWYRLLIAVLLFAWVAGAAGATWHAAWALASARELRPAGATYRHALPRPERWFWWGEVVARWAVLAAGVVYFVVSMVFTYYLFESFGRSATHFPIVLDRITRLDSGVSPLLLLVLGGVGFAVWCTWHLQRVKLLRWSTPFEAAVHGLRGRIERGHTGAGRPARGATAQEDERHPLSRYVAAVRGRLFMVVPTPGGALLLALLGTVAGLLYARFQPTVERIVGVRGFTLLLSLSVLGSVTASVWAVYRLLAVWRSLERVLESVGETPLLPAFRRLPVRASQLTRLTLWAPSSRDLVKTVADGQWRQLLTIYNAGGLGATAGGDDTHTLPGQLGGWVKRLMKPRGHPSRVEGPLDRHRETRLLRLAVILRRMWRSEPDSSALGDVADALKDRAKVDTGTVFRDRFDTRQRLWLRAAEEFAAVQVVDFVEWTLQQMRTLALFIFITLIVTTALISSYPFQPQAEVKLVFAFVMIATVASLLYVMVAMNRDEVLSHIADTDPGRISWSWGFALNVGVVALVPLLTLISSEVPGLHSVLFSWIQPVLNALTHGG